MLLSGLLGLYFRLRKIPISDSVTVYVDLLLVLTSALPDPPCTTPRGPQLQSNCMDGHGKVLVASDRAFVPGLRVHCMQRITIDLWHNDETVDWSIEINGRRHEHVTSEIIEALVESVLIGAETSLTRAVTTLYQ